MSEPLSSVEIEDVLSSIRRLVSEDMRPAPRGPVPLRHSSSNGDKLILTPALRVVEDAPQMGDVVTTLGARVAEVEGDWESETGDVAPMALDVRPDAAWAVPEAEPEAVVEAAADSKDDAPAAAFSEGEGQALETEPEILTAAVVDFAPEPLVLPLSDAINADGLAEEDVIVAPVEARMPGWAQQPAPDEDDEAAPVDPWQGATLEPDPEWADAAEAQALEELSAVSGQEAALGADDEMRFEEEVLRELVRDILREELQGNLGERITRNIRKLVRAEVALALAARDLS